MSWNYRITRRQVAQDWHEYDIREVCYYGGGVVGWSHKGLGPWSDDSVADLRSDYDLLGEAFNKPVLDITDEPYEVTDGQAGPV